MAVKKKKQKKFLPMLVLLLLLAALLIGYSVLSAANDRKEAELAAEEAAQNASILLAEYDMSTTTSVSYSRNGGDFLTFRVENGAWVYDADPTFPLNQETVSYMASALSSVAAVQALDSVDKAAFGLTEPAYVIKVSYSDGTSHTYEIGDYNSFNGAYYFTMDGEGYMISSGLIPYFDYELEDLLSLDSLPVSEWQDVSYISSVTVTRDGVQNVITDEAGLTDVLETLGGMALTLCADYYATADDKAADYGMDGANSVSVKYKKPVTSTDASGNEITSYLETTCEVWIGSPTGHNDGYYGGPVKSNIVYQLDNNTVLALLGWADYVPAETEE